MKKERTIFTSKVSEVLQSDNFIIGIIFLINAVFQSQGINFDVDEVVLIVSDFSFWNFIEYIFPLLLLFIKKVSEKGFNKRMLSNTNFWITVSTGLVFFLRIFGIDIELETAHQVVNDIIDGSLMQAIGTLMVSGNIAFHSFFKPRKYTSE